MKFSDLVFRPHPIGGEMAKAFFANGFGVSVIRSSFSFGGRDGLFELAVLKGTNDADFCLCYDTEITDDVIGHLTPIKVERLLNRVRRLKTQATLTLDKG